jgi:hypothetical protein
MVVVILHFVLQIKIGYLSEQVDEDEIGALQGAADTVRTMSNMLAYIILSNVFAYCIR